MREIELLTASEAAPLLKYRTAKALRAAAHAGFVPRVMIGKTVRFDPEAIKEWKRNGGTPLKAENEVAREQVESLATAA